MKKITLTIGIPAHNEAANIANLLTSILRQKAENYVLKNIIVMCDGTTDKTDEIAKKMSNKFPVIKVVNDGKRKGKLGRLLDIYKRGTSDAIVIFDGDVALANAQVLNTMAKTFLQTNAAIVGANNQPVPSKEFIGKLISTWSDVWYYVRKSYNSGDNVHNIRGCCMMLEKSFAKSIAFPKGLISESQYIYFLSKKQKKKFIFVEKAIVYYQKPTTISDYFLQFRRATPEELRLEKIFGDRVKNAYKIPRKYKIRALMYKLTHDPFYTVLSAIFTYVAKRIPYKQINTNEQGIWKRVDSTKRAINVVTF